MTLFRAVLTAAVVVGLVAVTAAATYAAQSDGDSKSRTILLRDDCDPKDPGWDPVPGDCVKRRGTVSAAEFGAELESPLSTAVVGHEAWRFDPSYSIVKQGTTLKVKNVGGRPHTFTKVAQWGGGVVPELSKGLVTAPECGGMVTVPAGGRTTVSGLAVGSHRFICCFHPWQRAIVEVAEKTNNDDDD